MTTIRWHWELWRHNNSKTQGKEQKKRAQKRLITVAGNSSVNLRTNTANTWKSRNRKTEKQLQVQVTNSEDCKRDDQEIAKGKGNLKRETESFSIAVQNNNIRTNYIKAKIDNK